MRTFTVIWVGQLLSFMCSQLTSFGLGVWVYQQTGSATLYGWTILAATAPNLLASPWAGVLVDRWDRRRALLLACAGGGLCSLVLAVLFWLNALHLWAIFAVVAAASMCNALDFPALSALVTQLVPKQQLGRANGMVQLGVALGRIMGLSFGGVLLERIGLVGILSLDVASFVFAITALLLVRQGTAQAPVTAKVAKRHLSHDLVFGFKYITSNHGLVRLMVLFLLANFNLGVVQVAVTPLVLEFSTPQALGGVLAAGGVGMLAGSLLMIAWGGPRRRIQGILGFGLLQGGFLVMTAAHRSVVLIAACAFGVLFAMPLINASSQSVWQRIVPLEMQGRVFAARAMLVQASLPLAYLVGGPLLDGVLSKDSMSKWLHGSTLERVFHLDAGRGAALLLAIVGLITLAGIAAGMSQRELLALDDERA